MLTCPHCNREFASAGYGTHVPVCLHNPVIRERVAAAMLDPDAPGWARTKTAYSAIARRTGAPSVMSLVNHCGSWAAACAEFGVIPAPSGRQRADGVMILRQGQHGAEERAFAEVEEALLYDRGVRAWVWEHGLTVSDTPRELPDGRLAWMVR